MAFKLGSSDIKDVKHGTTQVKKIMLGEKVVWEKMSIPTDYVLALDFNGNVQDISINANHATVGNAPTFSTGRKGNDMCANFSRNGIGTSKNVIMSIGNVSVSVWLKFLDHTSTVIILETGSDVNYNKGFFIATNNVIKPNGIEMADYAPGINIKGITYTDNGWNHFTFISERKKGTEKISIYKNGQIMTLSTSPYNSADGDNFPDLPLYIGAREISAFCYIGQMQHLKIYNRILTQEEIIQLYNE